MWFLLLEMNAQLIPPELRLIGPDYLNHLRELFLMVAWLRLPQREYAPLLRADSVLRKSIDVFGLRKRRDRFSEEANQARNALIVYKDAVEGCKNKKSRHVKPTSAIGSLHPCHP